VVIHRAEEVLKELEGERRKGRARRLPQEQLPLFAPKPTIVEEILKLDLNSLTPLEALIKLYEIQKKAKEGPQ
jgi:DNA mismatch repair protein MutS